VVKWDTFYEIDPNKLQIGDILLVTDYDDKPSSIIRFFTASDYSHAAICNEFGSFIEAQTIGVKRLTYNRIRVSSESAFAVLRVRDEFDSDGGLRKRAAAIAGEFLSHEYDFARAATSIVPLISLQGNAKVFCSHLVALAYERAGIKLVDLPPDKVVPGAFCSSIKLRDVSSEVRCHTLLPIATTRPLNPAAEELKAHRSVMNNGKIRERIRQLGVATPPSFHGLVKELLVQQDSALDAMIRGSFEVN
jgi:hypothetical protein